VGGGLLSGWDVEPRECAAESKLADLSPLGVVDREALERPANQRHPAVVPVEAEVYLCCTERKEVDF